MPSPEFPLTLTLLWLPEQQASLRAQMARPQVCDRCSLMVNRNYNDDMSALERGAERIGVLQQS